MPCAPGPGWVCTPPYSMFNREQVAITRLSFPNLESRMKKPSLLEGDYMDSVSPCAENTRSSPWYSNTGDTRVTATAAVATRSACDYAAIRKGLTENVLRPPQGLSGVPRVHHNLLTF